MPFKITYKGKTYYSDATTMSSALRELGIARTASYQARKISTEDYNKAVPGQATTPTPAPTTPTPTTPTPTTPPATTTTKPGASDTEKARIVRERLDQQVAAHNESTGQSLGVEEYLNQLGGITQRTKDVLLEQYYWTPTTTPTTADEDSYNKYLEYVKTHPSWPTPKNLEDWLVNRDYWEEVGDYLDAGYSLKQIDSYTAFQAYQSKYRDLQDWQPRDLAEFLQNPDKAQEQLDLWKQEAGPEAVGFIDDQIREFYTFKDYQSKYGEPSDWKPVDIGDFFTNYDTAQQQLGVWQQQAEEVEKYELEPGEAARRREEAYEESRYAAEERYRETPEYQPPFQQWLGEQGQFSGALEQFVESQYPSLKSEFQATQPELTGFPTREAARTEETRRKQAWQGWLSGRTPELEQEYWGQRPEQRGERLWMQTPTMRTANW